MKSPLENILPDAFDALPQAVFIVSRAGVVLWRNTEAKSQFPDEAEIMLVLRSGGLAVLDATALHAMCTGTSRQALRNVSVSGKGSRQLTVDILVRPLPSSGDECPIMIVAHDVSERVSMERRLAASERMIATGKLAARVAHELNNPLDGVLRYLGLADRLAGEEARKYLDPARAGLMRMAGIINDLKSQGEGPVAASQRQNLDELLQESVTAMQPRADALGVAIVCDLDDSPTDVPASMFQVFCNVIRNALDAMKDGGMLKIRLECRQDGCVIEFTDTGSGLDHDQAERIFEPFYTTKSSGGMGLGLAISREIVERSGGTISAAPGAAGGTVITIRLPATPQASG